MNTKRDEFARDVFLADNSSFTEFLEARIAEDEALAINALGSLGVENNWWTWSNLKIKFPDLYRADAQHMEQQSPRRVLAECEAKRAIIRRYQSFYATRQANWMNPNYAGAMEELGFVLETLAAVHSDHPDYQQEWAL